MTTYTPEEEAYMAKRTMIFYDKITEKDHEQELQRIHKKTNVRDTSKQAYKEIQPKLSPKQRELYTMLKKAKRPLNDHELAKYLGWQMAAVNARRNELMDIGKVKEYKKAVYAGTGKLTTYWEAV